MGIIPLNLFKYSKGQLKTSQLDTDFVVLAFGRIFDDLRFQD